MTKTSKIKIKKNKVTPFTPDYITINGSVYEKQHGIAVDVELELSVYSIDQLDKMVESGKYVSRGDAVRDIIRNMLRDKQVSK